MPTISRHAMACHRPRADGTAPHPVVATGQGGDDGDRPPGGNTFPAPIPTDGHLLAALTVQIDAALPDRAFEYRTSVLKAA